MYSFILGSFIIKKEKKTKQNETKQRQQPDNKKESSWFEVTDTLKRKFTFP